ncbi:hypothetical protein C8Q80DRAFT_1153837 [Daedaleopsis nitida]|nr:hypothetical protein C8Q80DRAFT_1153837 [Daedaleopsis nitida]
MGGGPLRLLLDIMSMLGKDPDPDSLPSETHTLPTNSAWSTASQPHASASSTQVPTSTFPQVQPQMLPSGVYPTANWQVPTWPTGPSFNPFCAPSPYWNTYPIGTFQHQHQPQPQLPLESFIQDFAAALADKMRPMLHKQTDGAEAVPPARLASDTGTGSSERSPSRTIADIVCTRDSRSPASSETASCTSSCLSKPPPSERSMRGMGLSEYHDNTYIPPSIDTVKPRAPPRDFGGDIDTFTDEEKVFFIQYLCWRLREGPLPRSWFCVGNWGRRSAAPHHDHLSWKRHWDNHPSMPDQIYIEARKRCEREASTESDLRRTASPPVTLRLSDSRSDHHRGIHPWTYRGKRAAQHGRKAVTDEDVRAMALYMVEKRRDWNKFKSHAECWWEFAERPQNRERRNFNAWNCAARQNADRIMDAYDELMGWKEDEGHCERGSNRRGPSRHITQHQPQASQPQPAASTSTSSASINADQGNHVRQYAVNLELGPEHAGI